MWTSVTVCVISAHIARGRGKHTLLHRLVWTKEKIKYIKQCSLTWKMYCVLLAHNNGKGRYLCVRYKTEENIDGVAVCISWQFDLTYTILVEESSLKRSLMWVWSYRKAQVENMPTLWCSNTTKVKRTTHRHSCLVGLASAFTVRCCYRFAGLTIAKPLADSSLRYPSPFCIA